MLRFHDDREERASSAVHIVAFLLAIVLLSTATELIPVHVAARDRFTLFSTVMMLTYLASALFHAVPQGKWKNALERVDHAAIFFFIAASYSLFSTQDNRGITAAIWTVASAGALISIVRPFRHPAAVVLPYIAFGWLAVGAIAWQARLLSNVSLALLISGALVYTAGLKFYLAPGKHRFSHAGWHLFVVAGSAVHATAAFV